MTSDIRAEGGAGRLVTWDAEKWKRDFFRPYADYRFLRKQVWENTLAAVGCGCYISADGTEVRLPADGELYTEPCYYSREFTAVFEPLSEAPEITVVPDDCLDKAREWVGKGLEVCVLNMANAYVPGGGVRSGAGAQEEYLFRCSDYYRSLYRFTDYAERFGTVSARERYPMDRDFGGIYSPNVTVFRGNESSGYPLLSKPYQVNMIAVAGIDMPELVRVGDELRIAPALVGTAENKIRTVLRIACRHGQRALVLGALGCGAFRNPPAHIAELFRKVLSESEFGGAFGRICFAVKADRNSRGDTNYLAFKRTFE